MRKLPWPCFALRTRTASLVALWLKKSDFGTEGFLCSLLNEYEHYRAARTLGTPLISLRSLASPHLKTSKSYQVWELQ